MSRTTIRRVAVRLVTHLAGAVILLSTVTACDTGKNTDKGRRHDLACLEARDQAPATPGPLTRGGDGSGAMSTVAPLALASEPDTQHLPLAPNPNPTGSGAPSTANPTGCW